VMLLISLFFVAYLGVSGLSMFRNNMKDLNQAHST
jgi:hypothetical protein